MAIYERILVPLDGSRLAEALLDYAVWLAQKSGAELHLLHVNNEKSPAGPDYLDGIKKRVSPVNVNVITVSGDPASEILRYTDEQNISLVTMSTHGHTGIKRWILGSVADKVVRYSNRPVRLVKSFPTREAAAATADSVVLALLDGSAISEQVLPYAAYHAKISNGTLVLMNICEPPAIIPSYSYYFSPPHEYPPERPLQWNEYVKEETKQRKKECGLYMKKAAQLINEGVKTKTATPFGDPPEEIIKYLESNAVSLVAMTTKGRSGFSRWVLGSVAEKVLQASNSPVLLIRPEEKS